MRKKVVFVRTTSVINEPRVIKEGMVLQEMGLEVNVIFWDRLGADIGKEEVNGIKLFPLFLGKVGYGRGIFNMKYRILITLKIFNTLKFLKPDIIHACDLDGLIPALMYKKLIDNEVRIVYDIFDFIYTLNSPVPVIIRKSLRILDLFFLKYIDAIILPDANRSEYIPDEFRNKIYIVNNAPKITKNFLIEKKILEKKLGFKFSEDKIKIFYAGALSKDRGILWLLDIASRIENVQVIVAGSGALEREVKKGSLEYKNISFLGKLPVELVYSIYPYVDIVYVVYDPNWANNRFSSPTKLFEALHFGKPVIISKGTYWDKFVEKYDCGWVCDYNLESLISLIASISKDEVVKKSKNTAILYDKVKWENSEKELKNLYRRLLE